MLLIEGQPVTPERIGSSVIYIPLHAQGDATHRDCKIGIITNANEVNVFVRYCRLDQFGRASIKHQSVATHPQDLRWW